MTKDNIQRIRDFYELGKYLYHSGGRSGESGVSALAGLFNNNIIVAPVKAVKHIFFTASLRVILFCSSLLPFFFVKCKILEIFPLYKNLSNEMFSKGNERDINVQDSCVKEGFLHLVAIFQSL